MSDTEDTNKFPDTLEMIKGMTRMTRAGSLVWKSRGSQMRTTYGDVDIDVTNNNIFLNGIALPEPVPVYVRELYTSAVVQALTNERIGRLAKMIEEAS